MPATREVVRILDAGFHGELLEEPPDLCEVLHRRLPNRALAIVHLEQDVDERAALEIVLLEPVVEHVEDGQEPVFGKRGALLDLPLEPIACPPLLAQAQELDDELVLRGEVAIEGALGDARVLDHRVDPDRLEPVLREEVVRRVQDPLARGLRAGQPDGGDGLTHVRTLGASRMMIQVCLHIVQERSTLAPA